MKVCRWGLGPAQLEGISGVSEYGGRAWWGWRGGAWAVRGKREALRAED